MFSARAIARIARAPAARFAASSVRSVSTQTRPSLYSCRSAIYAQRPRFATPFSTSFRTFEKQGTVDEELSAKFDSELEIEKEMNIPLEERSDIQEFLDNSPFKLIDKPGQQEVELVSKFGDETIRVVFSISDINNLQDQFSDKALFDEDLEEPSQASAQSGGAQSKQAKADKRVPTQKESTEEDEELFDEGEQETAFPARLHITIEKPNAGALQVDAIAQDGMIVIDNVYYHKSAQLATAQTAEADWERRGTYAGPPFGNLDEDLQVLLERYLEERGINTALALFIPEYIDAKEQKEYLAWLENVKKFVEA
ncbi:Mitochondrial acidic protein mam33 [Rhizina undulata]